MTLKWYGEKIKANLKQNVQEAAKEVGESLFDEAQSRVPVKTGNLKESGNLEVAEDSVAISYDAEYAYKVHENPNSTGYKWLERTLIDAQVEVAEKIAKKLRGDVK